MTAGGPCQAARQPAAVPGGAAHPSTSRAGPAGGRGGDPVCQAGSAGAGSGEWGQALPGGAGACRACSAQIVGAATFKACGPLACCPLIPLPQKDASARLAQASLDAKEAARRAKTDQEAALKKQADTMTAEHEKTLERAGQVSCGGCWGPACARPPPALVVAGEQAMQDEKLKAQKEQQALKDRLAELSKRQEEVKAPRLPAAAWAVQCWQSSAHLTRAGGSQARAGAGEADHPDAGDGEQWGPPARPNRRAARLNAPAPHHCTCPTAPPPRWPCPAAQLAQQSADLEGGFAKQKAALVEKARQQEAAADQANRALREELADAQAKASQASGAARCPPCLLCVPCQPGTAPHAHLYDSPALHALARSWAPRRRPMSSWTR